MPMSQIVMNIDRYGNTSTASIPIAICEAKDEDRITPGDILVLVGFGAGLTWGALVLEWSEPEARPPISVWRRRRRKLLLFLARLRSFALRILRKLEGLIWSASSTEE